MIDIENQNTVVFYETRNDYFSITYFKIKDVIFSGKSEYQYIDIFDTFHFGKVFILDGVVQTVDKFEFMYHEMLVHVGMISHPNPKKILVIGGGDGGTVREVVKHPTVEKVIMCEIDKMVVEVAKKYLPNLSSKLDDPRVELKYTDGSKFVKSFTNEFDLIIVDSTDPDKCKGGMLFTTEFFKDCYTALKEDGILVAQSESPIYDPDWVKLTYERVKKSFPITKLYGALCTQYPSGYWTYTIGSKKIDPEKEIHAERIKQLENLRYYSEEIHRSSFALPPFIKELLS